MGFIALSLQLDLFHVNELIFGQSSFKDAGFVTSGESKI